MLDAGVDSSSQVDAGADSGAHDAGVDSSTPDAGHNAQTSYHLGIEILGYDIPEFRRRTAQLTVWALHDPGTVCAGCEAPDVVPAVAPGDVVLPAIHDANSYVLASSTTAHWTIDLGSTTPYSVATNRGVAFDDVEGLGDYVGDTVSTTERIGGCTNAQFATEAEVLDSLDNGTVHTATCPQPKVSGYAMLGDVIGAVVVEAPLVFQWRVVALP